MPISLYKVLSDELIGKWLTSQKPYTLTKEFQDETY